MLQLLDASLVKVCEADDEANACFNVSVYLNAKDAPAQHQLARELHLDGFEAHVGCFMGEHARDIQLDQLDRSTAAILRGACKMIM